MSAEILSQEEVDALLNAGGFSDKGGSEVSTDTASNNINFSNGIIIGNIVDFFSNAFAPAVSVLDTILNKKISFEFVKGDFLSREELSEYVSGEKFLLKTAFETGLFGNFNIILDTELGKIMAELMIGQDGTKLGEFDDLKQSALNEAFNQIVNSINTIVSEKIDNNPVSNSLPEISLTDNVFESISFDENEKIFSIIFKLNIEGLKSGYILFLFSQELFSSLNNILTEAAQPAATEIDVSKPAESGEFQEGLTAGDDIDSSASAMSPVRKRETGLENLRLLLDVPLTVRVILGRNKLLVKDILELGSGSILELNKLASEYVDLFVEDKLIARGEVVVIDENFGVRIIDIVTPEERVEMTKSIK